MKLSLRQLSMLRSIGYKPRQTGHFSSGVVDSLNPDTAALYLYDMAERGFIEKVRDLWHITRLGEIHLENQPQPVPPRTISSYTTAGTYKPQWGAVRAGAEDFLRCRSAGLPT